MLSYCSVDLVALRMWSAESIAVHCSAVMLWDLPTVSEISPYSISNLSLEDVHIRWQFLLRNRFRQKHIIGALAGKTWEPRIMWFFFDIKSASSFALFNSAHLIRSFFHLFPTRIKERALFVSTVVLLRLNRYAASFAAELTVRANSRCKSGIFCTISSIRPYRFRRSTGFNPKRPLILLPLSWTVIFFFSVPLFYEYPLSFWRSPNLLSRTMLKLLSMVIERCWLTKISLWPKSEFRSQ